jgi:PAS domain S-box-containing protein
MIKPNDSQFGPHELAPSPRLAELSESEEHFVHFYDSDEFLIGLMTGAISDALAAGDAGIVVATSAHREALQERLQTTGLDLAAASAAGRYVAMDAADTLSTFMVDGLPDGQRFAELLGGIISDAAQGGRRIRIFGEMVALLWAEGNHAGAARLEDLWNDLRKSRDFSLFCAYPMNGFAGQEQTAMLGDICSRHVRVIPAESYSALTDPVDRLAFIATLQQKAGSLEAEIAHRKEAEHKLQISEVRYRRLFEASMDGILIVDAGTHKITDANPAVAQMLQLTPEELIGKELWEAGLLNDRQTDLEIFRQLMDGEVVRRDLSVPAKDGTRRDLELTGAIYRADGQQFVQCSVRDVTQRRESDQIRSHMAAIIESSDDAIISKTLEGVIMSWNAGAERIFGYTAEEIIGKPIYVLIPPGRFDEEPAILEKLRRGERVDHYETVRLTKEGREVDISVTVSPVRDSTGRIVAASKIARDITDRRQFEIERDELLERAQAARASAEAANRIKDEFLALLSHELRTPLNAILGWARMLRTGKFDDATAGRAIETIERNAKAQAQLIEDLLDVSRIITGKLRIDPRPVDPGEVITAAVDAVRPAADAKRIQLRAILDPLAVNIQGDPNRLQQIVWNLLSNAVKFTPAGGAVQVQLRRADSEVEISVTDTGRGINPEFLPFVFDRFRQQDSTLTRTHGGLGLGLAIVRHLSELHGGTAHAYSRGEGTGATFTVKFPTFIKTLSEAGTESPEWTNPSPDRPLAHSSALDNLLVLAVDDHDDTREMLNVMLRRHGARVIAVKSAEEAVEAAGNLNPDILVSDIEMPGEDGYSLIRRIRETEAETGRRLIAIALTAHARVEDRLRALSAGYQSHVAKPIEPAELIAVIESLTRASARQAAS